MSMWRHFIISVSTRLLIIVFFHVFNITLPLPHYLMIDSFPLATFFPDVESYSIFPLVILASSNQLLSYSGRLYFDSDCLLFNLPDYIQNLICVRVLSLSSSSSDIALRKSSLSPFYFILFHLIAFVSVDFCLLPLRLFDTFHLLIRCMSGFKLIVLFSFSLPVILLKFL